MALSLGRSHGTAVLGQPLAVSFDVRLDPEDDAESACISADVVQGDTRIDAGRIRTSITPAGQSALVKVTTSVAIEEPVVSVVLKAGCSQNVSRRYVMLTELSPELRVAPTAAAVVPIAPFASNELAPLAPPPVRASAPARVQPRAPTVNRAAPARPAARQRATPTDKAQQRPAAQRKSAKAAQAPNGASGPASPTQTGRPRLQLESATILLGANGGLKTSDEVSAAAENPAQRASASVQWRALNTQAQDITRQDAQEAELRSLRDAAAKDKAQVVSLTDRLQQAEQARYANGLVYGLFALLLAALLALVYLWRRKPPEPPAWWLEQTAKDPSGDVGVFADDAAPEATAAVAAPHAVPVRDSGHAALWVSGAHVDVDVDALLPVAASASRKSHRIHPEDLADVQQHADFFVSLGQYGQAIEVLRAYIGDHPNGSPVAYLDLLQIYQSLGRHADYQQLGYVFEKIFNATVPEPAWFKQPGSGLEDYPDVLQQIEAVWGMPEVLDLLEAMVRRTPQAEAGPFSLGAYRELLLLHAVAIAETDSALMAPRLDVADRQSGWASNFGPLQQAEVNLNPVPFVATSPAPGQRYGGGGAGPVSAPVDLASTYDLDIDLDLDLTHSGPDTRPHAPKVVNSNMVDFDLFDPDVEEDIAPKSTRR